MSRAIDTAWIEQIVDQFSVHQPRGHAKGTIARRTMKRQLHKALAKAIERSKDQQVDEKLNILQRFITDYPESMPKLIAGLIYKALMEGSNADTIKIDLTNFSHKRIVLGDLHIVAELKRTGISK